MNIEFKPKQYCALGVLSILVFSLNAEANPWLDTGDMKLRHELQMLSDAGILDAPLTTWPLSSKDIHRSLNDLSNNKKARLHPELMGVLANINERLEVEDYGSSFKLEAKARTKKQLIRDFSGEGREKASVSYDGSWGDSLVDVRLKATVAEKSDHTSDQNFRLDESYIASTLGNWKFTVGKQSRWWGPSWDGSLILSNNARPIPSLSLENVSSEAFDNKWLRWLGPNKLHMFIGQLESDRHIPNAKLIGSRFTFKPFKSLEVGLNRTIQWGGGDGDESLKGFFKTFLGLSDNSADDRLAGNSIAGGDIKWNLPVGNDGMHYSLYGQYIGEDRAIGTIFLGDETYLLGASASGLSSKLGGSWRTYIEATDTSAAWFKGRARNNIIYNHSTYQDGYRYQGVSMGHGIDSDSQIISAGAMLSHKDGNFWRAWVKHAKLNLDGVGENPIASANGKEWSTVGVSLDKKLNKRSKLNIGLEFVSEKETDKSRDNDLGASVGYSITF